MPHNPVSHDVSHVFAERQTRGPNYIFQVLVNHHILHILHPKPRVAVSAMPESMANMPCTGSVLRITSIPPAHHCPGLVGAGGVVAHIVAKVSGASAPVDLAVALHIVYSPAEPAQGSPAGGSGGAAVFTKVEEVKEEGL